MKNSGRRWFPTITVVLLCAQLVLLWLHGSLLNNQRSDIASLRYEIRELAALINETLTIEDGEYTTPATGTKPRTEPHHLKLATMQQDGDSIRNDLEKPRESARDAVRQAREAQEQASLTENAKKAEEKAKAKKERQPWPRWVGIVIAAMIGAATGVWLRNRRNKE